MIYQPSGLMPFEYVILQLFGNTDMNYQVSTYKKDDKLYGISNMCMLRIYNTRKDNYDISVYEYRGHYSVDDAYLSKFIRVDDRLIMLLPCCGFIYAYIVYGAYIPMNTIEYSIEDFKKFFVELPTVLSNTQKEDLVHDN